jgi:hypothetical protein
MVVTIIGLFVKEWLKGRKYYKFERGKGFVGAMDGWANSPQMLLWMWN